MKTRKNILIYRIDNWGQQEWKQQMEKEESKKADLQKRNLRRQMMETEKVSAVGNRVGIQQRLEQI